MSINYRVKNLFTQHFTDLECVCVCVCVFVEAHKDVLFSRTDPRNLELTREWEKNEANKFMYVVMQLIVFLMAVISFIYAHCTQLITVGLPATDPNSLYVSCIR